ncbi:hypothetical protein R1flu_012974 [Riccia fluitans]|uniref:C3H1-type domain-containing protein n=1 Tax=Riccia fluitans TaxID=41844 RepID=A0ABD1ZC60_9MARC
MRPGQNFYYAQHQQQAVPQQQGGSNFRPDPYQPQQHNPSAFLSPLYPAGPHDLHGGVQVVTLPIGSVAQQYAVTPIPPPQQWGHLRETQEWGNGGHLRESQGWRNGGHLHESQGWGNSPYPSQGLGLQYQGPQFTHQDTNVAFVPPQHHGGDGLRGPWGYGHDGPNGRFDRSSMHQEVRRPVDGGRLMEHVPLDRGSRAPSREHNYEDNRPKTWSNGGVPSNPRNMFGGRSAGKGRGGSGSVDREPKRSQAVSLRCEPCDRTLTNAQQFAAHKSTHVKCDVKGCSFEASGRVVKEHKQTAHESSSSSAISRPGLSKESEEEILRWREERRRNYPTTSSIKRKAVELEARKARGELVDEDAKKRRERLKEILARQAELGVPVAELPPDYFCDDSRSRGKGDNAGGGRRDNNRGGKRRYGEQAIGTVKGERDGPPQKQARILEPNVSSSAEPASGNVEAEEGEKHENPQENDADKIEAVGSDAGVKGSSPCKNKKICYYFRRGRCRKGRKCEFLHERSDRPKKPRKDAAGRDSAGGANKKQASLLYKLLEPEIRRDKSHLMQSFRFLVNNKFLEEYPQKPLKLFEWTDIEEQSNSEVEVGRLDREIQEGLQAVIENAEDEEEEMEHDDDNSSDASESDQDQQP